MDAAVVSWAEPQSGPVGQPEAAISVRQVAKTFGDHGEVRALEAVDFEVRRGEFVSLLGPSGCGKSTLLRIVAGLVPSDPGGQVKVLGRLQADVSDDVGVVFQTHNMLPWLDVEHNLRLAAEVRGMDRAELDPRIEELLTVLKLATFRRSYPHELSGGMRQRAGLGQILALRRPVLLLDEPFGALDALTRDQLNIELLRIWQEMQQTVVLVTHSISEAVFLSDRVLVMSDRPGRIVEQVDIDLPRPRSNETKATSRFGSYVVHLNDLMGVR